MYQSEKGIFTTTLYEQEPAGPASVFSYNIVSDALEGLGDLMAESQNTKANLVAESVITFGVKDFGQQPYQPYSNGYLPLYALMIQGLIEYLMSYSRLIYSTFPNPPASCLRTVSGSVNYEDLGWFVQLIDIAYMIPVTLANGAALYVILRAMQFAKAHKYPSPYGPRKVKYDLKPGQTFPDEWKTQIALNPITLFKDIAKENDFRGKVANIGESGAETALDAVTP
jgi:hypothetical protein